MGRWRWIAHCAWQARSRRRWRPLPGRESLTATSSPQNVIVVGRDEQVKLTDFGVGRLRETALGSSLTGLGAIASEYTAPEQLRGGDAADRTDIYALGAVLYAMLTGSAPSPAATRGAVEANDLWDAPQPLRKLRPEIPAALEHFVMRAMARRPERRQSSMEEFVEGLRDLTASVSEGTATASMPFAPPEHVLETPASLPDTPTVVATPLVNWQRHSDVWQSILSGGKRAQERPCRSPARPCRSPARPCRSPAIQGSKMVAPGRREAGSHRCSRARRDRVDGMARPGSATGGPHEGSATCREHGQAGDQG